jgi:hypothetical protein
MISNDKVIKVKVESLHINASKRIYEKALSTGTIQEGA